MATTDILDDNAVSTVALRCLVLGDSGVGKTAFVNAFTSSLASVCSNDQTQERIPSPVVSSTPSPPSIDLKVTKVRTSTVLTNVPSPEADPLGLIPPEVDVPAREVSFVMVPGYSSSAHPASVLETTDHYIDHHLHSTTSVFSPTIPSTNLAWFLIAGSRAHTLPTCAFYLVLFELKPIDLLYMKLIHDRVNLIPVLTKADALSSNERWILKKRMVRQLKLHGIRYHSFGQDQDAIEAAMEQRTPGQAPFFVSTRRDSSGKLMESELQQLIQTCLYTRVRGLQEDGARKVIEWRNAFGPQGSEAQPWAERSLAQDSQQQPSSTQSSTAIGYISPPPSHTQAAYLSPPMSDSQLPGNPADARLELIHQSTGMAIDNSTRPNVIMDENGINTVHTPVPGSNDGYPAATPGSEVKIEIPNSITSHRPSGADIVNDLGIQQQPPPPLQTPQITGAIPQLLQGGFQTPGTFLVPSMDPFQAGAHPVYGGNGVVHGGPVLTDVIWEAVELGDLATVQFCLHNGISPDQRNSSKSTLLHKAAWQGAQPLAVMTLLISYGANVNLANENGNTVLQNILMKHDDPKLIKLLLDNGAEASIPNREGMNALEVAALFNRPDSVRYLLENDLSSSEAQSLANALNRAKTPDKKVIANLLRSWKGKEGEKKRQELQTRLQGPVSPAGQHQQQQQPLMVHQLQATQASTGASDATSVRSFDTHKGGDANPGSSKASSLHHESKEANTSVGGGLELGSTLSLASTGSQAGSAAASTGPATSQSKNTNRFTLKTMRAAAPSMSNLFSSRK